MIPKHIAGGRILGKPETWDDATGACLGLYVRECQSGNGPVFESAWEPTPKELEMLNAGGAIHLRVVGGQPPVALWVEPEQESTESSSSKAGETR